MVAALTYGRLGNFLFQAANALAIGKRNSQEVVFDADCPYASYFPNLNFQKKFRQLTSSFSIYREPEHSFNEIPYFDNTLLDGYFQSDQYIRGYKDDILEQLGFIPCFSENSCFIHVRRTDYLLYPTKHPFIGEQYLVSAVWEIYNTTGVDKFCVYSDDIAWCKDFFENEFHLEEFNFAYSPAISDIDDLYSMAQCANGIISNSSFSWWSAYACANKNKVIIAPKVWFGIDNSHLSTLDLIPESWIKV